MQANSPSRFLPPASDGEWISRAGRLLRCGVSPWLARNRDLIASIDFAVTISPVAATNSIMLEVLLGPERVARTPRNGTIDVSGIAARLSVCE